MGRATQTVNEERLRNPATSVMVFRNEIIIDRPVEQVWPQLFKFMQWNPHHIGAKIIRLAGEPDCEGEIVLEYPKAANGYGPPVVIETVKVIPFEKLVWKLSEPQEKPQSYVVNFTDFSLESLDARTRFIYHSYFEVLKSALGSMPSDQQFDEIHREIFESLKRFVESQ